MRVLIMLSMLALLTALAGCQPRADAKAPAAAPQPVAASEKLWGSAPDFSFETFAGQRQRLSDYAGQPVVVDFWAAWCPYCIQEMPQFDAVYKANAGRFVLLGIATSSTPDPEAFVKARGFDWVFGMDIDGGPAYDTPSGIPVTVFIDRNGNVSNQFKGLIDQATFEAALAKIL